MRNNRTHFENTNNKGNTTTKVPNALIVAHNYMFKRTESGGRS